jgi:hypothetical protein
MASPRAGIITDQSAANASAFNRVEANPATGIPIQATEIGISMNGAPNSTLAPVSFILKRTSTVGTGSAATIAQLQNEQTTALQTTGLVENSADGTLQDTLHRWFVPVVSGIIWVAAPGREVDCQPADFLGVQNEAALGASINANVYMVFEE